VKPGTIIAGRFRIEEEAATGGMGTVYRALDTQTGLPVAVKVIRNGGSGDTWRFGREIRVVAGLSHPSIVKYVAHGVIADGLPFLASEWIAGVPLSQRLAHEGLTAAESVSIVAAAASALAVVHNHGVVHRDVKPDNILFADGDLTQLKVIDFGIAREAIENTRITRTGAFIGTLGYVSPEQARGDRNLDARSDVFALGCVLYECLTGRCAFSGSNLVAVRTKTIFSEPPAIAGLCPELPAALAHLVSSMLAKAPAARPRDGATVAEALAAVGTMPATERRPVRPPQPATDVVHAKPSGVCLVLAATRGGDTSPRAKVDALRAALAAFGAHLERLADGVVAITVSSGDPVSGARCALAVRALIPDAAIVLIQSSTTEEALDEAIDRGTLALEELTMRALFAEAIPSAHEPGGIRIDKAVAGMLDGRFHVTRAAGGYTLHGERPNTPTR
jgi:eukaryotic-like serine/threonine-protein kinase